MGEDKDNCQREIRPSRKRTRFWKMIGLGMCFCRNDGLGTALGFPIQQLQDCRRIRILPTTTREHPSPTNSIGFGLPPLFASSVSVSSSPEQAASENRAKKPLSAFTFTSPLLTSATVFSNELMDPILHHPSIQLLDLERRPRKKLKPRHKAFFSSSCITTNNENGKATASLFETLAMACCDAGVVPRKEFFETYAAALLIHHHYNTHKESSSPKVYRIADLAAGHGLLSWMLLALDEYAEDGSRRQQHPRRPRTAICIDRRMPPSAIAIARSMRTHLFPIEGHADAANGSENENDDDPEAGLYDRRWTYVETDLGNLVVDDASTLLVSVHACGTLSDYLIDMAIAGQRSPLALVPCCHTYSARKGYAPHPLFSDTTAEAVRSKIEGLQSQSQTESKPQPKSATRAPGKTHTKFQIVEDVIDEVRWKTLGNAGYGRVRIASLPQAFTERNRLFLAQHEPGASNANVNATVSDASLDASFSNPIGTAAGRQSIRKGSMPPAEIAPTKPTGKLEKGLFAVHVRDDPESIEDCLSVSGKAKAIERLRALIPNHFAPKLDVSMWLSPPPLPGQEQVQPKANVTLQDLQRVLDETVRSYRQSNANNNNDSDKRYRCRISPINEIFVHPKNGRIACTYQIEYSYESNTLEEHGSPFPKQVAKELHKNFCESVVRCIDGTEIR